MNNINNYFNIINKELLFIILDYGADPIHLLLTFSNNYEMHNFIFYDYVRVRDIKLHNIFLNVSNYLKISYNEMVKEIIVWIQYTFSKDYYNKNYIIYLNDYLYNSMNWINQKNYYFINKRSSDNYLLDNSNITLNIIFYIRFSLIYKYFYKNITKFKRDINLIMNNIEKDYEYLFKSKNKLDYYKKIIGFNLEINNKLYISLIDIYDKVCNIIFIYNYHKDINIFEYLYDLYLEKETEENLIKLIYYYLNNNYNEYFSIFII